MNLLSSQPMQARELLPHLNDGLAKGGLAYRARLASRATNENEFDVLELVLAGARTALSVQVNRDGAVLCEETLDNGNLIGGRMLVYIAGPTPELMVLVTVAYLRGRI